MTDAPAAAVARALARAMIRKGLTVLGTIAVTRGLIDQGSVDSAMGQAVEITLGALTVVGSGVWTWFATTNVHQRLAAALAALRGQPTSRAGTPPTTA